ncbi:hypothetical protein DF134_19225 [Burkholderia stagnalis]|uniref:hypothetical protein n=1 Tax=Burkholderia stagnalis TaxID=1503054 RepID=UPI000F5A1E4B|nr:hypothetical protein [Burkholderia stagnalis]RQQ88711.1 hypothetical protein DF134_19225 [Burkholderia stagnalis]
MLQFDGALRYASPGEIPWDLAGDLMSEVIMRVATQTDPQTIYEDFKRRFAQASGRIATRSSNEGWAESDLRTYMQHAAENAALFVEALYDAMCDIERRHPEIRLPPWSYVNSVLAPSGYAIDPPNLLIGAVVSSVAVPEHVPSLDSQANELIQRSLAQSEDLLNTGRSRQAVQEILWLLETISTAFEGTDHESGTVQGKYFNRIIGDLKKFNRGRMLSQVASWMETLHGYLSSPGGGGVRHGTILCDAYELSEGEARLICDLTRSYISYLLFEHQRLGLQ